MRHALLASVAIMAIAAQSYAAERRPSLTGTADQHIRVEPCLPTKRTTVTGIVGQPTTFTFPIGEKIFGVAQSHTLKPDGSFADADWHQPDPPTDKDGKGLDMGNNLSLWPFAPGTTIMTVVTITKDGMQRPHPFKLVAKPERHAPGAGTGVSMVSAANAADTVDDPEATYNLICKGGAPSGPPEKAERVAAETTTGDPVVSSKSRRRKARLQTASIKEANEFELAQDRLRTDSFNHDAPCHYVAHGPQPSSIEPRCPMTNQQWVLMRFPGLSKKPAIYIVEEDGSERYARQHASGDIVVIEEIAQHFRLRLGSAVLDVLDTEFNPVGSPANSGTIAASVNRQILKAQPEQPHPEQAQPEK